MVNLARSSAETNTLYIKFVRNVAFNENGMEIVYYFECLEMKKSNTGEQVKKDWEKMGV